MLAAAIECRPFECLVYLIAPVANRLPSLMCRSQLTTLERIGKADDPGSKLRGVTRNSTYTHLQIVNASLRKVSNVVSLLATYEIKGKQGKDAVGTLFLSERIHRKIT